MKTERLPIDRWNPEAKLIERAARVLENDGLVGFPTETVYGLGANGLSSEAVRKIFLAKGRPSDNPLILHLRDPDDARRLARVDDRAAAVMKAFWPGPLTLVLPAQPVVPAEVTAGLNTVALRMPDHPVALSLIEATGFPIAAPSANLSGRPSPTDADAVETDLGGHVDLILDAGPVDVGLESTVIDLTGNGVVLLRPGGMPIERVAEFLGKTPGCPDDNLRRRSPGTRYRHYAPLVPVCIWRGGKLPDGVDPSVSGFLGLSSPPGDFARSVVFETPENFARGIFAGFRRMESERIQVIVVEWPAAKGIGLALQDRILRAAGDGGPGQQGGTFVCQTSNL